MLVHRRPPPDSFAFLSGAAAFGAVAASRGDASLARTAAHLRNTGIAAAVPGLIDYLTTVAAGQPKQTATRHMLSNLTALGCFALAAWTDSRTLAYHHRVGVTPEPEEGSAARQELHSGETPIAREIPSPA